MYNLDVRVTRKIRLIQGKDMRDPVNLHSRGQPRIVHLYSANAIPQNQISPDPIDLFAVRKKSHDLLNRTNPRICFCNRQTKTVVRGWARTYIPKLAYILGSVTQVHPAIHEGLSSKLHNGLVRIVFFGEPEKDVRINEISRPVRHQSWS
jgi:hypothetical protein